MLQTYFSAAWSRTGRKGPYAHYYVQVQPNGGSFVGMCTSHTFLAFVEEQSHELLWNPFSSATWPRGCHRSSSAYMCIARARIPNGCTHVTTKGLAVFSSGEALRPILSAAVTQLRDHYRKQTKPNSSSLSGAFRHWPAMTALLYPQSLRAL